MQQQTMSHILSISLLIFLFSQFASSQETCSLTRNDTPKALAVPTFCFPTANNAALFTLNGQKEAVKEFCDEINRAKASWTSDGLREKTTRLRELYAEYGSYLRFWDEVPWYYYQDPFVCQRTVSAPVPSRAPEPVRVQEPVRVVQQVAPASAPAQESSSSVVNSFLNALLDRVTSSSTPATPAPEQPAERIHSSSSSSSSQQRRDNEGSRGRPQNEPVRDRAPAPAQETQWGWAIGDTGYNTNYRDSGRYNSGPSYSSHSSHDRDRRRYRDRIPSKLDVPEFCLYRSSHPGVDKFCNSLFDLKGVWDRKGHDKDMLHYLRTLYTSYKQYLPVSWVPPPFWVDVDYYNYYEIDPYYGLNPHIDPLFYGGLYGRNFIGQPNSISYTSSYVHPIAPVTQPIVGFPLDPYLLGGAGFYGGFGGFGGGIGGFGGLGGGYGVDPGYYGPSQYPVDPYGYPQQQQYPVDPYGYPQQGQQYPQQQYPVDPYGYPQQGQQYPMPQQQYPVDPYGYPQQGQQYPMPQQPGQQYPQQPTQQPQYPQQQPLPTYTTYPPTQPVQQTQPQQQPQYPVTQQPAQQYPPQQAQQPQYPVTQQPAQQYPQPTLPTQPLAPLPQYPAPVSPIPYSGY